MNNRVHVGGAVAALLLSNAVLAEGVPDNLELSATISGRAVNSLMLDIDRAGNRIVAVGERGHILYSEDNGNHWQQGAVPVAVNLTAVDFISETEGWAVGHDGVILHSQDGGTRWHKQLDGIVLNQMLVASAEQRLSELRGVLEGAEESEQLQWQIENAEFALDDALVGQEDGPTKPLLNIHFIDEKLGFAMGAYGLLLQTGDGGKQWLPILHRLDNPDGFHLNAMTQAPNGTLYLVGEAGSVFRSQDRGKSWKRLPLPYEGSLFDVLATERGVTVVGLRGHLFFSSDQGVSWQQRATQTQSTLAAIVNKGEDIMVVGSEGVVLTSSDGGQHYRLSQQADRKPYSAVSYLNDNEAVAVGVGGAQRLSPHPASMLWMASDHHSRGVQR